MSTEGSHEQLVRTPSDQTSINMGPQRGSNNQALKVAGVTLLAGILIAGQAFTAYMAYSQKEQLNTLQRRSDRLQEIHRKSAFRAPLKMHMPMNSLAMTFLDDTEDKKDSSTTSSTPKPVPSVLTKCQKEAAGETKSGLPFFSPKCDENGDYLAEQCWEKTEWCWCVDKNGVEIADSLKNGSAQCSGPLFDVVEPMVGQDGQ